MQFVCYFLTAILLALFMPDSLAQSYTYNSSLQTYTECGSGYYESWAMSYSNCWALGGTCMYEQGHVCVALWTRSSSTGTLSFRVAKCNGCFVNGNSGKVFIHDNYYGDVYCTDFHIYDDHIPYVPAKIYNYGDFTGRRTFDVFLITEDQVYKFYAGRITIQAGGAPISNVYAPTNVTAHSATLNGCVNPNGDETQYAFFYGTTLNCTQYTSFEIILAGNNCINVSADITGLNPETD